MKDLKENADRDLLKMIAKNVISGEGKTELSDDDLANVGGGSYDEGRGHKIINQFGVSVVIGVESDGTEITDTMTTVYYSGKDYCSFCKREVDTKFFECHVPVLNGEPETYDVCESCLIGMAE